MGGVGKPVVWGFELVGRMLKKVNRVLRNKLITFM